MSAVGNFRIVRIRDLSNVGGAFWRHASEAPQQPSCALRVGHQPEVVAEQHDRVKHTEPAIELRDGQDPSVAHAALPRGLNGDRRIGHGQHRVAALLQVERTDFSVYRSKNSIQL